MHFFSHFVYNHIYRLSWQLETIMAHTRRTIVARLKNYSESRGRLGFVFHLAEQVLLPVSGFSAHFLVDGAGVCPILSQVHLEPDLSSTYRYLGTSSACRLGSLQEQVI